MVREESQGGSRQSRLLRNGGGHVHLEGWGINALWAQSRITRNTPSAEEEPKGPRDRPTIPQGLKIGPKTSSRKRGILIQ